MIDNAREIEEARAYGDLRENSEYKFALERRSRLQGELQLLSKQLNLARILTPADIDVTAVSPGTAVVIENSKGQLLSYTLLGPWDADVEKNILSFQSKLAENMLGLRIGEKFEFQNEKFKIVKIESFLS
jgi:transcription elongation GreA/GreB family factor